MPTVKSIHRKSRLESTKIHNITTDYKRRNVIIVLINTLDNQSQYGKTHYHST